MFTQPAPDLISSTPSKFPTVLEPSDSNLFVIPKFPTSEISFDPTEEYPEWAYIGQYMMFQDYKDHKDHKDTKYQYEIEPCSPVDVDKLPYASAVPIDISEVCFSDVSLDGCCLDERPFDFFTIDCPRPFR
jgi:hypothetical protein